MTAPITSSPTTSSTSGASSTSPTANPLTQSLGYNDFIKLLVAQMQNQDPTAPQDGTQMATQMAQFSSVEQLMNINNTLTSQGSTSSTLVDAMQNASAIGLIGKQVSIADNTLTIGGTNTISPYRTDLASSGNVTLSILDSSGKVVRSESLGSCAAGRQSLDVAGLSSGLAAGSYTVQVSLADSTTGAITNPAVLSVHTVDGVQFGANGLVLRSGTNTYPLSGVTSVDASN